MAPHFIDSVAQILKHDQRRAFIYFQTRTTQRLFGQQDVQGWIRILLQLGPAESVVKHGIVALASFHESVEAINNVPFVLTSLKQTSNGTEILALKHYNEAIQRIRIDAFDASRRGVDRAQEAILAVVGVDGIGGII